MSWPVAILSDTVEVTCLLKSGHSIDFATTNTITCIHLRLTRSAVQKEFDYFDQILSTFLSGEHIFETKQTVTNWCLVYISCYDKVLVILKKKHEKLSFLCKCND